MPVMEIRPAATAPAPKAPTGPCAAASAPPTAAPKDTPTVTADCIDASATATPPSELRRSVRVKAVAIAGPMSGPARG